MRSSFIRTNGHTGSYRGTDLSEEAVGRMSSPVRGLAGRVAV